MAGNAMSRRASYMYGNLLPPDPKGQVGAGLGTTTSAGTVTLIPPTDLITETGQKEMIDGLTYEFLMAPGSEAPAEMLWYIEEKKAIEAAEDATHTLHNTYSLRGAKIREPLPWSKYLNQALAMWGDKAEVLFAQHHWPTWGNRRSSSCWSKQRDLYRYINDETLRMANQGMTMREIAEQIELPDSLATFWANRGYYGSLYHDVAATYVLYLGWFDGNPATLHELPPVEASKNYVEFMGGADAVLAEGEGVLRQGRLPLGGAGRQPRRVRRSRQPGGQGSAGRRARAARLPGRVGAVAQLLPDRRQGAARGRGEAADAEHRQPRHGAGDDARTCSSTISASA